MLTLVQNVWICRQYLIFGKKSFIKIINHLLLSTQLCGRFHYTTVKDIECKISFWTDCHETPKTFEEEKILSVFSQRFTPSSVLYKEKPCAYREKIPAGKMYIRVSVDP